MLVKKTKKTPMKKETFVTNMIITSSTSSTKPKTLFKDNLFTKSLFLNL